MHHLGTIFARGLLPRTFRTFSSTRSFSSNLGVRPKVVVGMSGGVDSSVAALLLKQQGFDVHGVFIRSWDSREESGSYTKKGKFSGNCAERDFEMVQKICGQLGIPCSMVDFVKEYWNEVFLPFLDDNERGNTPNPDILCNRFLKFDACVNYAIKDIGADFVATGHYAKLGRTGGENGCRRGSPQLQLLQAVDDSKDQTYFLSGVPLEMFERVLFPLADIRKSTVKQLASDEGLLSATKKENVYYILYS